MAQNRLKEFSRNAANNIAWLLFLVLLVI